MQKQATAAAQNLIVKIYVGAIERTTRIKDRDLVITWLKQARDILANNEPMNLKVRRLHSLTDTTAIIKAIGTTIARSVSAFRTTKKLSISVKVGLGFTVALMPFFGGQSAGIAAIGTAVGLPVALLIFIGTTGITSIIESLAVQWPSRTASIKDHDGSDRLSSGESRMKDVTKLKRADPPRRLSDN